MASNLPPPLDIKANALTPNRRYGAIQEAPWSKWGWGLLVPLVFAGNVVAAIFAWFTPRVVGHGIAIQARRPPRHDKSTGQSRRR
jgi:hypothetical protein